MTYAPSRVELAARTGSHASFHAATSKRSQRPGGTRRGPRGTSVRLREGIGQLDRGSDCTMSEGGMYPVESLAKECQQVLTNKEKRQRRPVSRVLSPGSVARPRETVISLGRRLPGASSSHTRERHAGRASPTLASGIALLFGFAPGGVYQADPVTRAAGELLPHRFTLTALASGGLFSVALSRGVTPPGR